MQVLIVEDDAALGVFLQKGLKLEGHEVAWVGDGEAALEHARTHRPDLMVLDLSLQWGCPMLTANGFTPKTMALVLPGLFVEEFGMLPLRVAGSRILYLGFEDHLDASVAFALEQMTDLKVESGLMPVEEYAAARQSLLEYEGVPLKMENVEEPDAPAARITAILEQKQPVASKLVRMHKYFWLRLWLESGAKGIQGALPRDREDTIDYVFKVGGIAGCIGKSLNYFVSTALAVSGSVRAESAPICAPCVPGCEGPSPSLMIARESGINLVCQPLSDWNFRMALSVAESQWPLGSVI